PSSMRLGAHIQSDRRCAFHVWAPHADRVAVHLVAPHDRLLALTRGIRGYHSGMLADVQAGSRYLYRLDDQAERPDPASRYQPDGVHGPSEVVDARQFPWTDAAWRGVAHRDLVIYELHVGTFTPEGTFVSAIGQLDRLRELGVTAVEIMPV